MRGLQVHSGECGPDQENVRATTSKTVLPLGHHCGPVRGHSKDKRIPQCSIQNGLTKVDSQQLQPERPPDVFPLTCAIMRTPLYFHVL